jgi:uncharacterized protein (TIGR02246 family)
MRSSIHPRVAAFALALAVPLAWACEAREDDAPAVPAETPAPPVADAPPPELEAVAEQYTAAWNGNDAAAVAAFFTDDAMATVDGEMYHGRDEIRTGWIEPNVGAVSNLEVHQTSARRDGDSFHAEGTYTARVDPPDADAFDGSGRYTLTWTLDADGQWRISNTTVDNDEPPQG